MPAPVVIVASGGAPFVNVQVGGFPVTVVPDTLGYGFPITIVSSGAPAITLLDTDGTFFDTDYTRITEDGAIRLTEDGDERVTENAAGDIRETEDGEVRVDEDGQIRVMQ